MGVEHWKKNNFTLEITEDSSPTLRPFQEGKSAESMHHSGGAFSETIEIYGIPMREVLQAGGANVVSVGLGLGYNELLCASLAQSLQRRDIQLISYEKEDFLVDSFLTYLQGRDQPEEIQNVYNKIEELYMKHFSISDLKQGLLKMYKDQRWIIRGALDERNLPDKKINCYLYDPYSAKTNPSLWSEEFLGKMLSSAQSPCVFLSYAATGNLNRALRAKGFTRKRRFGFQGKRESTFAVMGL